MNPIQLTNSQLLLSLVPLTGLLLLLHFQRFGLTRSLMIAATRLIAQLTLVGLILKYVFEEASLPLIGLITVIMLLVAAFEVRSRQKYRLPSAGTLKISTLTLMLSSFTLTLYGLAVVIQPDPWFTPQFAIPLFGMILSNTMTGVSVGMERLTSSVYENQLLIQQRLMLGEYPDKCLLEYKRNALRSGMTPVINAMATAGIVSLPGMMTGQILAGSAPTEAVKYQILIWVFIAAGTGLGMWGALQLTSRRLFDQRCRLTRPY